MSTTELRFKGPRMRTQRLYRGFSQADLARRAGVVASMVSQLESGVRRPSPEVAVALAEALGVSLQFLAQDQHVACHADVVHFRRRVKTKASARYAAFGHVVLLAELVEFFEANLRLPVVRLPEATAAAGSKGVEEAARATRRSLGLDLARPLASTIATVEAAGAVVVLSDRYARDVDAFSMFETERPIVILNLHDVGERVNFTAAHELGHAVLHRGVETGTSETERQADQFASALLMPAEGFAREFPRSRGVTLNWDGILRMKPRWGTSAAAMVTRAKDLRLITPTAYRRAFQFMSARGWRRPDPGEPGRLAPELPTLLTECFDAAERVLGLRAGDVALRLGWTPDQLKDVSCAELKTGSHELGTSSNVIPMTRRR